MAIGTKLYGTGPDRWVLYDAGILFVFDTTAGSVTTLHSFDGRADGAIPNGPLLLIGTTLYGMALFGGPEGKGTIFAYDTAGGGFRTVFTFSDGGFGQAGEGGLAASGSHLFGIANNPDTGLGMVITVDTTGFNFRILRSFEVNEGSGLSGGLVLSGGWLYGMARDGG